MASQTFTSDLDADLNSYKKDMADGSGTLEKMDDHEYLNGSTAGFGKKLREINREINQEQYGTNDVPSLDASQTNSIQVHPESTQKMKDIDLESLQENKNKKKNHSDLKFNNGSLESRTLEGSDKITVQQFKLSKFIKTTKNSDEGNSKQEGDSYR